MNLNKVLLIGRLTQDPEVRTTPGGQQVSTFSVATNRVWIDQSGQKQEKTEFHNVVSWRKLAERVGKYLIKGQEVFVEGRMETRSWEGPDGAKKYRTEIVADRVEFGAKPGAYAAGRAAAGENAESAAEPEKEADAKEAETPSASSSPQGGTSKGPAPQASRDVTGKEEEINIEDIPF